MDKSIITIAYELMLQTKLTYQQIATGTGLNLGWVQHYCQRVDKGQDFHAMKVETLIRFLTNESK